MHFERIYLQKNFQTHPADNPFLYDHIGIGVFVKEGESMEEAEKSAKEYIADYVKRNTHYPDHSHIQTSTPQTIPDIQINAVAVEKPLSQEIEECTTLEDLVSYKVLAYTHGLSGKYQRKFKELKTL